MDKVISYSFNDNFIEKLADFILNNFNAAGCDFSRLACVFGGRRPAIFLHRELSKRINKSFIPPRFFSIDDFVDYLAASGTDLRALGELDAAFLIYTIAKKEIPALLEGRESFASFLPWAREIVSFIEQLDLEDIKNESLVNIEKSAQIGYEIPENINHLLGHIIRLRGAYHSHCKATNRASRGMRYLKVSESINNVALNEFDTVLFCNFFYLHASEKKIIKNILERGKGICIFQGSQDDWSVLKNSAKEFGCHIRPKTQWQEKLDFSLYQGFDIHSQCCIVRTILKEKIKEKDATVIVLPRPHTLIPLLTEISPLLDEFNVSMGYPLKRSPLYALFEALYKAQETKKDGRYYTKDYLGVLQHAFVKNLKISTDPSVTRVLIHKLEEVLQGEIDSSIGGSLFLSLQEIEDEETIYRASMETLRNMGINATIDDCKKILLSLHKLFFTIWEDLSDFENFSSCLEKLLEVLIEKAGVSFYPFNVKVIEKLQSVKEELQSLSFAKENFARSEIWEIFKERLQGEIISFSGSPLRGMQILGLLETRSLNFKNVIIMDSNESVFPKLKIYEPLIPREVMLNLGLNRLEKEEEIQRYQFMRLISSATNVHLIYEENQEKEKSRFIEELLWKKQKQAQKIEIVTTPKASFSLDISFKETVVNKTQGMVEFLKEERYSASRINTYLRCPLQFYFKYVLGLEMREDLLDEPDASGIGTFLHELLEDAFKVFKGKQPIIDHNFEKFFLKRMKEKFKLDLGRRMKSDSFLLEHIMEDRLKKFLIAESKRAIAKIICLEEKRDGFITLAGRPVNFRYTVDRIDQLLEGDILIIDYKSGSVSDAAPSRLSSLTAMEMTRPAIKKSLKSFQLPIYYYFISKEFPDVNVNAALYSLRTLEQKEFISSKEYPDKEKIMDICMKSLEYIFSEITNPDIPFIADKEERKCEYCDFGALCR
ncbi:MAG: PD-(D/E)XK nuclease family protein [Candidatus Omnitrophica bacterium]|nr:PD-(D/E)XK nuclease family protein [Candidatus Omnitrophota bacterium]